MRCRGYFRKNRGTRGTDKLLYIDHYIQGGRNKAENVAMALINSKEIQKVLHLILLLQ